MNFLVSVLLFLFALGMFVYAYRHTLDRDELDDEFLTELFRDDKE